MDLDFEIDDYTIGWVCALPLEFEAATAVLDKIHPQIPIPSQKDTNCYKLGQIGSYNIVLACLPPGSMGTTSAAIVVTNMRSSFPSVENCLMVGIGGGAPLLPQNDIRLGDVVVGVPKGTHGGILPYHFGKTIQEGKFIQTGKYLNGPPMLFLNAISKLQSEFRELYATMADALTKNPVPQKERLSQERDVLCFEMEAEGIVNTLPFLVVRGICDYSDSHKNKVWQPYAALAAAAFARALILNLPIREMGEGNEKASKMPISLPVAKGAAFGSFGTDGEPLCLDNTRENLLGAITNWVGSTNAEATRPIFWLSGGAGTGKSTIARTVAKRLKDEGLLDGSFFFRRGSEDCSKAEKFMTTLANDLRFHVYGFGTGIQKALQKDPRVIGVTLREQFEELIRRPMIEAKPIRRTILVVDALDECDDENHVLVIVKSLALATEIDNSIRVFITSRGEAFINDIFKALPQVVQKRILHDVEKLEIENDIRVFLKHELAVIRITRGLPEFWPTSTEIERLVGIASPLFIVAANICRMLSSRKFRPDVQLSDLLGCKSGSLVMEANPQRSLRLTYKYILNQSLTDTTRAQQKRIIFEFKNIVGVIVLLERPLTLSCLSKLVDMDEKDVGMRLDGFRSVLHVPTQADDTLKTLHLSFREYLFDVDTKEETPFWLSEHEIHRNIAHRCIELMKTRLKKNICGLPSPCVFRDEILPDIINQTLTPDIGYACRYWVTHLVKAQEKLLDGGQIHQFLQEYCLEWLEATALLGTYHSNIYAIMELKSIASASEAEDLIKYLYDLERFTQYNTQIIAEVPLQVYDSALLWSPTESLVRKRFFDKHLEWVKIAPRVLENWHSRIHKFEYTSRFVQAIAFSPGGESIAVASQRRIDIWDCTSGALRQTINFGDRGLWIHEVEFFQGGRCLAISIGDKIEILDVGSGERVHGLDIAKHNGYVKFSSDSRFIVALGKDKKINMWSTDSWDMVKSLSNRTSDSVRFDISPDFGLLAICNDPNTTLTLVMQDIDSCATFQEEEYPIAIAGVDPDYSLCSVVVRFSPNGRYLVQIFGRWFTRHLKFYRVYRSTGLERFGEDLITVRSSLANSNTLEFISNDKIAIPGDGAGIIEIWDISSATKLMSFCATSGGDPISAITVSLKRGLLATMNHRLGGVDLLDMASPGFLAPGLDEGFHLATGHNRGSVSTDEDVDSPEFEDSNVYSVKSPSAQGRFISGVFSPDSSLFAVLATGVSGIESIFVLDTANPKWIPLCKLDDFTPAWVNIEVPSYIEWFAFSLDGTLLATKSADNIHVWRTDNWVKLHAGRDFVASVYEASRDQPGYPATPNASGSHEIIQEIHTGSGPAYFKYSLLEQDTNNISEKPRYKLDEIEKGWVVCETTGERFLWIPPDYRPKIDFRRPGPPRYPQLYADFVESSIAFEFDHGIQLLQLDPGLYKSGSRAGWI
ncbi:hypothetical protein TWF481_005332 [Arthrobotrys musiformis]|uniref:NACHT domain-containing protein n=1 Tax=Arthrobotrys musiformis TaxID=47236 RepID=A0AAV9WF61_9PEZI